MKRFPVVLVALILVTSLVLAGCSSPAPTSSSKPAQTTAAPTTSALPKTTAAPTTSTAPTTQAAAKLPEKITYSCHAVGTAIHAMVTALGKVASDYSGMLMVVQPTSGPSAWLPGMTSTGKPELGSQHSLDAWWAYTGKVSAVPIPGEMLGNKPFYPGYSNLRALAAPARQGTAMVVRQDSGIKTYADLKKKKYRIASGYMGQPSAYACLVANLLNQGMTLDDFIPVIVANSNEGIKALKEGRVDACDNTIGSPVVEETNATVPVRFLSASDKPEDIQRVVNIFPGSTYATWSMGPSGVVEPTVVFTFPTMTMTTTALPNEIAEAVLNAWWDHYQELSKMNVSFERITSPDKLMITQPSVPYHEGAINFFKKKGIWTAEMENYQQHLLKGEYPFVKQ